MDYIKKFHVKPESIVQLKDFNPKYKGKNKKKKSAIHKIGKLQQKMDELQYKLYTEHKQSLLIVLQALDTGGKDGIVRHVLSSMNPKVVELLASSNQLRRNSHMIFCGGLNVRCQSPGKLLFSTVHNTKMFSSLVFTTLFRKKSGQSATNRSTTLSKNLLQMAPTF